MSVFQSTYIFNNDQIALFQSGGNYILLSVIDVKYGDFIHLNRIVRLLQEYKFLILYFCRCLLRNNKSVFHVVRDDEITHTATSQQVVTVWESSTNADRTCVCIDYTADGFYFSFLIVGLTVHLMNQLNVWNLLPLPLTGLHFIFVLAIITTILGVFISMFIFKHALNPITQLSRSMQQVAEGNYNVKLDADPHKGEIHDLLTNFNHMVQELNSTETLHSDFISSVSHEFKTPLATISGYATLLQDDTLSAEERNEYINIIIRTTRELSHMTGNILSLSRLENQTIITDQEAFHVDEQIRQCILLRETIWSEKNLVIDPDLDSIIWKGNRELTSHIWNNLLDNAIKFTPAGGEITIRASMDKDWLTVSFTDTGIGMTPEVKQRVFDKFYQGDTSHKKKGNGLGLALVRQIVTLYGGSVEVESAPDMGSTFTVRLPAHTISSESSSEQRALHSLP